TAIGPVVAPSGTIAPMLASSSMVKVALVPLNWTSVAPEKSEPVIVTSVPTGPSVGANPVMEWAGGPSANAGTRSLIEATRASRREGPRRNVAGQRFAWRNDPTGPPLRPGR